MLHRRLFLLFSIFYLLATTCAASPPHNEIVQEDEGHIGEHLDAQAHLSPAEQLPSLQELKNMCVEMKRVSLSSANHEVHDMTPKQFHRKKMWRNARAGSLCALECAVAVPACLCLGLTGSIVHDLPCAACTFRPDHPEEVLNNLAMSCLRPFLAVWAGICHTMNMGWQVRVHQKAAVEAARELWNMRVHGCPPESPSTITSRQRRYRWARIALQNPQRLAASSSTTGRDTCNHPTYSSAWDNERYLLACNRANQRQSRSTIAQMSLGFSFNEPRSRYRKWNEKAKVQPTTFQHDP